MSDRVIAKMWIGGALSASRTQILIDAINDAEVFAEEGDLHFQPRTAADLMEARTDEGLLYLCDDQAPWGEMEIPTEICRRLGLPFKHWHEASSDGGSTISTWVPGMEQPVSYPADHFDHDRIFVDAPVIEAALELLQKGKNDDVIILLEAALPIVPNIPPFEVIEDEGVAAVTLSAVESMLGAGQ